MHTFMERIYDFYVLSWKCYILQISSIYDYVKEHRKVEHEVIKIIC